jgi:hypothetical protein
LKNLLSTWLGISRSSTRLLSQELQPNESLSTFVLQSNQVVKRSSTIHYSRLMPRRRDKESKGRLETSVCRSTNLAEARVWAICSEFFDKYARKPAIGRGVGPANAVYAVGLSFDADGKPYPEHANIIGWHDSSDRPDSELKHFWMDQAQRMAPHFSYLPRPRLME